MSIRHLDDLFEPASVAVIGASARTGSVGRTVWLNLRAGGFTGPIWPVNPRHAELDGEPTFASVAALPQAPALAVICTPAASVPGLIAELGARGTRAAVVLTAGLGPELRQAMLDSARPHLLRILGPNGLGLLSPAIGLNASFAHALVPPGGIAFVSQSGALVTAMIDWARGRGLGFSRCVSLGEQADIDFGDMLDWLASDARTRAILLYAESLSSARKFMSAARAAARNKPVIIVKSGRSRAGQRAAASHTGALAGSDRVIDAAIARAGMLRVSSLQELFMAAATLAPLRTSVRGTEPPRCVTLVTNGGGAGVLAADAAAAVGLPLAQLPDELLARLSSALPANWSRANPVDIIGDAPVERYVHTLSTLLAEPATGTLLFMHAPTAIVPSLAIAQALRPLAEAHPGRIVACWLGDAAVAEARQCFTAAGIACHDTPEQAVQALAAVALYRANQEQLLEAPALDAGAPASDRERVQGIVSDALAAGREWLDAAEAQRLLQAIGIAVPEVRVVGTQPRAAAAAAAQLGFPVALKIRSEQITHKSDVGGVVLGLNNAKAVTEAARQMLERVAAERPSAQVEGFSVQRMVQRPGAIELIAGTAIDPLFGPVVLFGAGGTRVEVLRDSAVALPPLNEPLARALVARTRVARLLAGWRDVPPADASALHGVLLALAQLLADEPRIAELDINPLLADAQGVIALDARVRVSAAAPGGAARFAIRPWPAEWVESFSWTFGGRTQTVTLRPVRPEDEARHLAFLERVSPEDIRLRIFYARKSIERSELARLVQIDYEREMAFVATLVNDAGVEETLAAVRTVTDPDNHEAEFGILVRSDLKGGGLGRRLMDKIVTYQKARGTRLLVATVLAENSGMLRLGAMLGMQETADPHDPGVRRLALELQPADQPA